jgi:hypothetical protein
MTEANKRIDHEAILRQAQEMRAQVLAEMVKSFFAMFRAKPVAKAAKA